MALMPSERMGLPPGAWPPMRMTASWSGSERTYRNTDPTQVEVTPLPRNVLAELQRHMARLGFVVSQIREIEQARQKRLEQETETGPHAMVRQVRTLKLRLPALSLAVDRFASAPRKESGPNLIQPCRFVARH